MKLVLLCCAVVGLVGARPQNDQFFDDYNDQGGQFDDQDDQQRYDQPRDEDLISSEMKYNDDGSIEYRYETVDSQKQDVVVAPQPRGPEQQVGAVITGSYSFIAKDENGEDRECVFTYTADEQGYRVESPCLPEDTNAAFQAAARKAALDRGYDASQDDYNPGSEGDYDDSF